MITHGIDMIEIKRIEKSMTSETFVRRVFGKHELDELSQKKDCAQSAAACFCAKEAFGKALGTGIREFALEEVEVLHDELGKPYLFLSGKAKQIADSMHMSFDLSITHTDEYAIASVIAFQEEKPEVKNL